MSYDGISENSPQETAFFSDLIDSPDKDDVHYSKIHTANNAQLGAKTQGLVGPGGIEIAGSVRL
jgi:hypothetical protein